MPHTLAVNIVLTEEFLSDILVTAFDAHYGGCWYWAAPAPPPSPGWETGDTFWHAVNIEIRYEDPGPKFAHVPFPYRVTHDTVRKGLQWILDHPTRQDRLVGAILAQDAGELDAPDCDLIVQAGIFGDVVYG